MVSGEGTYLSRNGLYVVFGYAMRKDLIIEGGDKCGPLVTACQGRHCTGAATAVVAAGGAC